MRITKLLVSLMILLASEAHAFEPNGLVVFLSDFGVKADAVAICKGVMLSHDRELRIIDLTHGVDPFNVREAAFYLNEAVKYFPPGTVFVGVVDPGVGTNRRAIVLETEDKRLVVAPDNGLASLVARDHGIKGVWEVTNSRFMRPNRSSTFDGRDLFAPSAAVLASGKFAPEDAGAAVEKLVRLDFPVPQVAADRVRGIVLVVGEPYGNVWTNIGRSDVRKAFPQLPKRIRARIGDADLTLPLASTFADVPRGEALAYFNSRDHLSFAINQGNFAAARHIEVGMRVEVRVSPD